MPSSRGTLPIFYVLSGLGYRSLTLYRFLQPHPPRIVKEIICFALPSRRAPLIAIRLWELL